MTSANLLSYFVRSLLIKPTLFIQAHKKRKKQVRNQLKKILNLVRNEKVVKRMRTQIKGRKRKVVELQPKIKKLSVQSLQLFQQFCQVRFFSTPSIV